MRELEKSECVNPVMTITPIMNIERQNWGALGVLQVIHDGVFVCTCNIFYNITKTTTTYHLFVYDSHFVLKDMSDFLVQSLINTSCTNFCTGVEKKKTKVH